MKTIFKSPPLLPYLETTALLDEDILWPTSADFSNLVNYSLEDSSGLIAHEGENEPVLSDPTADLGTSRVNKGNSTLPSRQPTLGGSLAASNSRKRRQMMKVQKSMKKRRTQASTTAAIPTCLSQNVVLQSSHGPSC